MDVMSFADKHLYLSYPFAVESQVTPMAGAPVKQPLHPPSHPRVVLEKLEVGMHPNTVYFLTSSHKF